jgi:hypothetical protein
MNAESSGRQARHGDEARDHGEQHDAGDQKTLHFSLLVVNAPNVFPLVAGVEF